jgi:hypothetical protein
MVFWLFILTAFVAHSFRLGNVRGDLRRNTETNLRRNCADNLLDIIGFVDKYNDPVIRVKVKPQILYLHENTWTEGEVPWTFNDTTSDNDTLSTKTNIPFGPFDPLEPCSIGHLFI